MRYETTVQEANGEYFIELNREAMKMAGFAINDELKWVDRLDGSYMIMKKDMPGYVLTTEMTNPANGRFVHVFRSLNKDMSVVDMYEGDTLVHSRAITGHTEGYSEDCAENWVMEYGEFKR